MPARKVLDEESLAERKVVIATLDKIFCAEGLSPRVPCLALRGRSVQNDIYTVCEGTRGGRPLGDRIAAALMEAVNLLRARQGRPTTHQLSSFDVLSMNLIEPLVQGPDQFENPLYYQGLARQLGVPVSAQPTCRMPCVRALFGLRRCPRRVTAQSLAWYQRMVCID